jgi:hypothetical protein
MVSSMPVSNGVSNAGVVTTCVPTLPVQTLAKRNHFFTQFDDSRANLYGSCTMPCGGDPTEKCGNGGILSVYKYNPNKVGGTSSSSSAAQTTPTTTSSSSSTSVTSSTSQSQTISLPTPASTIISASISANSPSTTTSSSSSTPIQGSSPSTTSTSSAPSSTTSNTPPGEYAFPLYLGYMLMIFI